MAIEKAPIETFPVRRIPDLRLPGWLAGAIVVALVLVAGGVGALLMAQVAGRPLTVNLPGITTPLAADTVTVIAEGRVPAVPDTIYTDIGAQVARDTLPQALAATADDSARLTAALKGAGVDGADIQTTGLFAYPRTDTVGNTIGYFASVNLRVRIRDLNRATSVIDAAAGAIGNDVRLGQLQYQRSDIASQAVQARQLALASASDRASGLAKMSNRQLGKITSVHEEFAGYVPAGQMVSGLGGGGGGGGAAVPQVQSGQGEVVVYLTVTYSLN